MQSRYMNNNQLTHGAHGQHDAYAFTLVELLTVISVIAVLASLLFPSLAKAKGKAHAVNCLSSLRQWGLGMQVYGTDNNDLIPRDGMDDSGQYSAFTGRSQGPGTPNDVYAWFNVLPPVMSKRPFSSYWTGTSAEVAASLPFPGGNEKIWHCPSAMASPQEGFLKGGTFGFFSYAMNMDLKFRSSIINGVEGNTYAYPDMPRVTTLRKPAATVLLMEVAFSPVSESYTGDPTLNGVLPAARANRMAIRHNGKGGNLVFIDGHAQYYMRSYVTNGGGVVEKNNADVIWNPNRDIQ
jgi:prepilin-type N-terminal cleavage/methylation domain-containing protein/prepilin-type processing-associated H-X9-DG protein